MIDPGGQVTASYQYSDYGIPATAALPAPRAGAAAQAAVNPFGYDGSYTFPATGTQYLPARSYDPAQGRFLSLDSSAQINRYQAFNTNPINFTDPTGQTAVSDLITDIFLTLVFAVATVASFGAASAAVGAVAAAVAAGEEVTAAAVAGAVLTTASTLANAGAAATAATLTADDAAGLSGHNFLSASQRKSLQTAETSLGIIGTATGLAGAGLAGAATEGEGAATADIASKRLAVDVLDPGVSPVTEPSEGSSPLRFNESIGSISENPDPELAARSDTVNPAGTASPDTSYGAFTPRPPMTEAELMLADEPFEYSSDERNPRHSLAQHDTDRGGGYRGIRRNHFAGGRSAEQFRIRTAAAERAATDPTADRDCRYSRHRTGLDAIGPIRLHADPEFQR